MKEKKKKKHVHRYRWCRMADGSIMPGCRKCCRCGKPKS